MGWQGSPTGPSWETIARKMMVATRRFVECPNTGNQETLTETLRECEKYTETQYPDIQKSLEKGPWPEVTTSGWK